MTQENKTAPKEDSEADNYDISIVPHPDDALLDWKDKSLIPHPDDDVETRVGKRLERYNRALRADALKELLAVRKAEKNES